MIVDGRVHATTPARVIEEIDYRLEVLANGFPDGENGLDVRRLKGGSERWMPKFPAVLSSPWSKMDTQLAKLALILAVTRSADETSATEYVSGDDMRFAPGYSSTSRRPHGRFTGSFSRRIRTTRSPTIW